MKQRFEDVLAECLEAVNTGRFTIEECLARYPHWDDRLEPLLRLGYQLSQASFPEADSTFRETARERFLAAAQAGAVAPQQRRKLLPALHMPRRWSWRPVLSAPMGRPVAWRRVALTMAAALLLGCIGFSSFAVVSAGDSLPGDWQYPVKRLTERTRLAFTFGDNARRDYRISLAQERLHEVQQLASGEHQIDESVLRQLVDSTEPLVKALEPDSVPTDQIQRITDLTAEQKVTLDRVGPLVEAKAADELAQAKVVSSEGYDKAVVALAAARAEGPEETPGLTTPATGTPSASAGTASPTPGSSPGAAASSSPTPQAGASATPTPQPTPVPGAATPAPAEPTPLPGEPTPAAPEPTATPTPPERPVTFLPDDTTAGLKWNLLTIGDFSVRAPADGSPDWAISTLSGANGDRILVGHFQSGGFDASITVQVSTGQASIRVLVQGTIQEVTAEDVRTLVPGPVADVILHVLESIHAGP